MMCHTLVKTAQMLCFYGMIWYTIRKMVQGFVSLWYDIAYHSKSGAQFCIFI